MRLARSIDSFPFDLVAEGSVATIGSYDGLHRGHQKLLRHVLDHARKKRLPSIVMSFEPTPKEFFAQKRPPARLMRFREKFEALAEIGVDVFFCPRFDEAMKNISADTFIRRILIHSLNIKHLVIGDDFRFAQDRAGHLQTLQRAGLEPKELDFVINALPGAIGYSSLKRVIQAGKSGVDIAFYPEDFSELDELAKSNQVTWIVDMGVAPGMSHLLSAYAAYQLDVAEDIKIYVGGLPKDTHSYWQYKAPFSPSDVIEEYTRPARFVRDGQEVSMPALTDVELLEFPVVGQLEAFNSDGLRSLMYSLSVPNMIEKTLRYPGYVKKVSVLKESGLFSEEAITAIYQESAGVYRKTGHLARGALIAAANEQSMQITPNHVRIASSEIF